MTYGVLTEAEAEALDRFVARLRAARVEQQMSRRAVALAVGVAGPSVVNNWELGHRRPRADLLTAWAACLGVPVPAGVTGWRPELSPCGTVAGAQTHSRRGEPVCQPCQDARTAYRRPRKSS